MASVYYLFDDAKDIADYIILSAEGKYEIDKKRYFAALIIQRTFRGFAVRCHYRNMVRAAIVLQKHIRGYLSRIHMNDIAAAAFRRKCMANYDKLATKIQAAWRGTQVRKNVNIEIILAERRAEQEAQEAIAKFFSKIFEEREPGQSEPSLRIQEMGEEEKLIHKITKKSPDILQTLFEKHHLLRTYQIEGVLSEHGSKNLSLLETFLKKLECKEYMTDMKRLHREDNSLDFEYMFRDKRARKIEDLLRQRNHQRGVERIQSINKTMPKSIHHKPFVVSKKIDGRQYQKSMLASEKYTGYSSPVFREQVKDDMEPFNLDVKHIDSSPKDESPYFIDHWRKVCCNHNFIYDFMEDIQG